MTLAVFFFFTALVGLITWLITRGDRVDTSTGYFLGGRSLTGGFIAGSLLLTNLSTEQLVGLNGAAFTDGLAVMAWEVVAAGALVLMALFFLPRYLKSGIATIPEFLEKRFNAHSRTITSVIFILAYAGILLPIVLYTGALGLMGILDLPAITGIENETTLLWILVWFIGIVGSIYAIFGGLKTVAVSDTINGFGLLVGGIAITFFALNAVSEDGVLAALKEVKTAHPEKFQSIGSQDSSVPFSTLFTGVLLLNLFYWTTNQQIIQRTFGASSLAEGQKGVLFAGVFKMLAPLILVLPGIIAFHMYGSEIAADKAYGQLVRDTMPGWMAGFFAAVMVGAILSSFNSGLNATATLFSLGVYSRAGSAKSDQKVIEMGKKVGIGIAILAMVIAPLLAGNDQIFVYLQKMNGLYFIPIFAVMLAALFLKRLKGRYANTALVAGCAVLAAIYFIPGLEDLIPVHDFHLLGIVFGALMLFQILAQQMDPRTSDWQQIDSKDVDLTPWRFAKPVGAFICIVVIAIYLAFSGLF